MGRQDLLDSIAVEEHKNKKKLRKKEQKKETPKAKDITELHFEKFGVEPVIVGIHRNEPDEIVEGIFKAIETGEPYNELDLLTDEERKAYESGDLFF